MMQTLDVPIKRFQFLDACRGFAILWIVIFHILGAFKNMYGPVLSWFISHGYLGVQIFFVISGYGCANSLYSKRYSSPLSFLQKRLKRIFYPYWWHLIFAVFIIPFTVSFLSFLYSGIWEFKKFDYSFLDWLGIVFLFKVFFAKSWRLNEAFLPLNGVVWFIAIIVQIYLFFSFSLFFKEKLDQILLVACLLSFFCLFPLVRRLLPCGLFLPYFYQFYIGFFVFRCLHFCCYNKYKDYVFVLGLLLGALFFCFGDRPEYTIFLFVVSYGYLLVFIYHLDMVLFDFCLVRFFALIGMFSYSLYLLHVPLWPFMDMFVRHIPYLPSWVKAPLFLIPGIIFCSYIWYLFFEKPFTLSNILKSVLHPIETISVGFKEARTYIKWQRNR